MIRVYFNDKAAPIRDCHSVCDVETWREAKILVWASSKLDPYEYAVAWSDMAIEGYDNTRLRNLQIPEELKKDVERHMAYEQGIINQHKNESKAEDAVVRALNSAYHELETLIGDNHDFVEIVTNTAKEWAKECLDCAADMQPEHFNRYVAGDK